MIMKYYSQDGQDKFIADLFKNKRNGVFVDIGAYDGVEYSNSFFMEKELGWKGICIEPNPIVFERLQANRNCICLNCCVGDLPGTAAFLAVSGYGVMLSGILDFLDEKHLQRIDAGIKEYGDSKEILTVPVLPLAKIFSDHTIKTIDYCNIDVEGGEMSVLRTIDFNSVVIKVFTIENNYGSNEVNHFLQKKGYKLIYSLGADEVYELHSKHYGMMLLYKYKKLRNYLSSMRHKFKIKQ